MGFGSDLLRNWKCHDHRVQEGPVIEKLGTTCTTTVDLVSTQQYHHASFASTTGSGTFLYTQSFICKALYCAILRVVSTQRGVSITTQ